MKVIVIGSHLCEDTRNTLEILKGKDVEIEFFNLSEDLSALKKYLHYRETENIYEEVRKNGGIGIPLLVLEDGTKTFDVNEVLKKLEK
jgi:glutaredoxin-related protein